MAQRHEEETEFKVVPETLTPLCINNCGFSGNPATKNMCQNCYKASAPTIMKPLSFGSETTKPRSSSVRFLDRSEILRRDLTKEKKGGSGEEEKRHVVVKQEVNRCSGCRRKVGLTGFRCRCGDLFCSEHRYTDRHDCSFDYKAAGRDAIARENPVVKAAKIVRV